MAEETKKTMDSEEVKASEEEKTTREETADETEKQAEHAEGAETEEDAASEKKGFFVDGVVIRVFSKSAFPLPIFRPLATKVGPGFCPELQPPYSWTRCLPTKTPGWSCTKNQQSRTSRPADFTQLPTWVQRSVPFT